MADFKELYSLVTECTMDEGNLVTEKSAMRRYRELHGADDTELYKRAAQDPRYRDLIKAQKFLFNTGNVNYDSVTKHEKKTPINTMVKKQRLDSGGLGANEYNKAKVKSILDSREADSYRYKKRYKEQEAKIAAQKARTDTNLKKGGIIAAISLLTAIGFAAKATYDHTDKGELSRLKKETKKVQKDLKAGKITEEQATTQLKAIQDQVDKIVKKAEKSEKKA